MRILFYCDTVFSFGGVQRVLAEIAKALSGKHEVTILTTDTCTDLSMYGYAESTVLFDYFSYSASAVGVAVASAPPFVSVSYAVNISFTVILFTRNTLFPTTTA